jgi:hypothetical protein
MQDGFQSRLSNIAGVLVAADDSREMCPVCGKSLCVQKTVQRKGLTLSHGAFIVRETVRACAIGCRIQGALVKQRSAALSKMIPPKSNVGYDVIVYIGIERFIHNRQREEIRESLEKEYSISLSSGEISGLSSRFLVYLEMLHNAAAPALRAAMAADGGWPLHIDATGECGRGTLLLAYSGWRKWVLGSWKISTENADAIFPRLQETIARFGSPCAIMRDLGRAMKDASNRLLKTLDHPIPILACHQHFLSDIGTDLLQESHDKLRNLFRQVGVRKNLRAFVRDHGRSLGSQLNKVREAVGDWLKKPPVENRLPEGSAGIAALRAYAQWALDYAADGNGQGFPYDLPYLDFYVRCIKVSCAVDAFGTSSIAISKSPMVGDLVRKLPNKTTFLTR